MSTATVSRLSIAFNFVIVTAATSTANTSNAIAGGIWSSGTQYRVHVLTQSDKEKFLKLNKK